jgi:hypothetical protein
MTAPRWTQSDISYLRDPHVQAIGRTIIASRGILHGERPCNRHCWDRINRDWPGIDSAAMRVEPYDHEAEALDGYVVDNRWIDWPTIQRAIALCAGFAAALWAVFPR